MISELKLVKPTRDAGRGISVMVLGLDGLSIPIALLYASVNQRLLSGPSVIEVGLALSGIPRALPKFCTPALGLVALIMPS